MDATGVHLFEIQVQDCFPEAKAFASEAKLVGFCAGLALCQLLVCYSMQ